MMQVKLAKACRRREIGAPMTVTERAAYRMMITGEVRPDEAFMAAFAKTRGIKDRPAAKPPSRARTGKKGH